MGTYNIHGGEGEGGWAQTRDTYGKYTQSGILKRDSSRMCALWSVTKLSHKNGINEIRQLVFKITGEKGVSFLKDVMAF